MRHPHFDIEPGGALADWFQGAPQPVATRRTIVLATEERSGSEWLCQLMAQTGRLGRPSEYLNIEWQRRFFRDYPGDVLGAAEMVHRLSVTPNGVAALKLHAWHFDLLAAHTSLSRAFPGLVFVRLWREDRLGQAISLVRARQTDAYHAGAAQLRPTAYSAAAIQGVIDELAVGALRWTRYFARNGLAPLTLSYEALQADPAGAVAQIAASVGETVEIAASRRDELAVQRDSETEAWRRRFIADVGDLDRFDPGVIGTDVSAT